MMSEDQLEVDRPASPMSGDEDEPSSPDNVDLSLSGYLHTCHLPWFLSQETNLKSPYTPDNIWPRYAVLERPKGARFLQYISLINPYNFAMSAFQYMHILQEIDICNTWEDAPPSLRLPHPRLVSYDDGDLEFFAKISNSGTREDFTTLLTEYVLFTITEVIRTIERVPLKSPMAKRLVFQRVSELCTIPGARWDIFMMPNVPLAVIFIPPWFMTTEQIKANIIPRTFYMNSINTMDGSSENQMAEKLWAVIYDTCFTRCHMFILTTYTRWAFGTFNQSYTTASITEAIPASLYRADNQIIGVPTICASLSEMLIYWVQRARGRVLE